MFSHFQSSHARDHLPPPTNKKQPKPTQQHPAQHHTAHTNKMAITATSARGVNPPQRTAANDDQEHATSTQHPKESKRKADADNENVETLHQKRGGTLRGLRIKREREEYVGILILHKPHYYKYWLLGHGIQRKLDNTFISLNHITTFGWTILAGVIKFDIIT